MHNNINGKAAFSNGQLSLLRPAKPDLKHERINHFMRILFLLAIYFSCFFPSSLYAQCDFPEITDGCDCESAVVVCNSEIDGFVGTLPADECGIQPPTFCNGSGSIENPIWFSFVALNNNVQLIITPSDCTTGMGGFIGMQAAIYAACDDADAFICAGVGTENPINMFSSGFVIGQTYYLIIDGYGGSVCDFEIDAVTGVSDQQIDIQTEGPNVISGQTGSACVEQGEIFSFETPDCEVVGSNNFMDLYENGWSCYEWTITPNTFTFLGESDGPYIDVIFQEKANYTISVNRFIDPQIAECAGGSCADPEDIELAVCFIDTIASSVFLCPGEFINICGDLISTNGVFECFDPNTCTLTIDTVTVGGNDVENLGNIFLCPGECFELENEMYCNRTDYNIQSTEDCSKSFQFSVKDLSIDITPQTYPIVDCNGTEQLVSHSVTTNYDGNLNLKYLDSDGFEISTDNFVLVTEPGDYQFIVFVDGFEDTCSDTISFTIDIDDSVPDFSLDAETLTCSLQEANVEVISTDMIASYSWSGPDINGPLDGSNINVLDTGLYTVIVEGINGCTTEQSIYVGANYPPIDVEVNYEELDCNLAQTTLSYISSLDIDSVLWAGPNEFKETSVDVIAVDTGVYVLNLFASNGCDYSHIFKVLGNYVDPEFNTVIPEEWACLSETLEIEIDVAGNPDYSYNWFTESGIIQGNTNAVSLSVGSTGYYFIEVTDDETGCSTIDTIEVVANEDVPTDLSINSDDPLCFDINDGRIEIEDIVGGIGPFEYLIDGVLQTSNIIENLAPAEYEVSVLDSNGCEVKRMVTINGPEELVADIAGPSEAVFGENILLESIVDDVKFNIDVINWYDEAGTFLGSGDDFNFIMELNTVITMEVIDENGCIVIRTIPIVLDEDYDYFVPTIFTPNDDGTNDFFAIFTQNLPGTINTLVVYDRWGNKMFQADEIENGNQDPSWGWDGRFNGKSVNPGVYVYYAEVETLGIKKQLKGSVTLVR